MSKFHEVLKNRNFFFLWLGQIISQLGDRFGQMAIIGYISIGAPGSGMQLAKLLSFTILPVFIIGPVAGVYVDRWDRRRMMFISDLLRAMLVMVIPLFLLTKKSMPLVYFLIFLVFSIGRFFVPAKLSIIPELVKKEDLLIANSLVNITGMIAAIGGFALGGLIVQYWGVKGGFYLDGVSFFVSSALIFFIGPKQFSKIRIVQMGREIVEAIRKSVIQEVKEGLTYFIRKKEVGFTGLIMFLLGAAGGSAYVVGIVFIQQILHRTVTLGLGFLIMFLGIGLFLGALVYGRFGQRVSHFKMIFLSLFFSGLMLIIFVLTLVRYPYFSIAAVLSFILGLFVAPIIIAANTIVHNASTEEMMGKTFSSLEIAMHLGFFLFMFISSFLAEKISSVSVLTMVGFSFSLIGILGFFIKQKVRWLN